MAKIPAARTSATSRTATTKKPARSLEAQSATKRKSKGKAPGSHASGDEAVFAPIAAAFRGDPDVTEARMFGSSGLKIRGRVFAMVVKGDLVVKLPAARIAQLIGSRAAQPFDPGHGKVMKEWAAVPAQHSRTWLALTREAHHFVGGAS